MGKYEFTRETMTSYIDGRTLRRIRATRTFNDVKEGELGGWIEKENNLSQDGNAWVYDDAIVRGDAKVYGNAMIRDNVMVYDSAEVYDDAKALGDARIGGCAKIWSKAMVYGRAWINGSAVVCGEAVVCESASVHGYAKICGNARIDGGMEVCDNAKITHESNILTIGPVGSRDDFITFFRDENDYIGVKCGCFSGNIDKFLKKVQEEHGENEHARIYRACVEIARMRLAKWTTVLFIAAAVAWTSIPAQAAVQVPEDVRQISAELGGQYNVCPELVQSVCFKESGFDPKAENDGCIGIMQIDPKWHKNRMERLGITDLYDTRQNMLVGVDYLHELSEEYEDISIALMKYNGDSRAAGVEKGTEDISEYADSILELSAELERENGK